MEACGLVYAHEGKGPQRLKVLDFPLEKGLQAVLSHLMWVLGAQLGPSGGDQCIPLATEPSLWPPFFFGFVVILLVIFISLVQDTSHTGLKHIGCICTIII